MGNEIAWVGFWSLLGRLAVCAVVLLLGYEAADVARDVLLK